MAIADIILLNIANHGFAVRTEPRGGSSNEATVTATDLATGRVWRAKGPTLIDAAENLLQQLRDEHDRPVHAPIPKMSFEPTARHAVSLDARSACALYVICMTAAIFVLDAASPGINLGIFYLIPLWFAYHSRIASRRIAPLALVMVLLVLLDEFLTEVLANGAFRQEPAGLLNRCFAVLAITGSALVIKLFLAKEAGRPPGKSRVAKAAESEGLTTAQMAGPWILWLLAMGVAGTSIGDFMTPVSANLPIFYLVPIAVIASTHRPVAPWVGAILLALIVSGYLVSPRGNLISADLPLVLVNRIATGCGLALVALVCYLGKSGYGMNRVLG